MKLLLLGLVLHFTGAHGKYFWQQDKPYEQQGLWKVVEDGIGIVVDAVKHLDYLETANKFKLKEKLKAAKGNAKNIEKMLEGYNEEVRKSYEEKINQKFLVFNKKMSPPNHNLQELIKKSAKEIWPATSAFVPGLGGEFRKISVSDVAERSRDKQRSKSHSVGTKVEPYTNDVRTENEKHKENMKNNWKVRANGELSEYLDEFRAKVKTLFEELQENLVPYFSELHTEAENTYDG